MGCDATGTMSALSYHNRRLSASFALHRHNVRTWRMLCIFIVPLCWLVGSQATCNVRTSKEKQMGAFEGAHQFKLTVNCGA